jgi:hypothetical protein|tara:strand:+ start:6941 stop:7195 length:255 start_codon:yes stop_codon:yes gene_type:complete
VYGGPFEPRSALTLDPNATQEDIVVPVGGEGSVRGNDDDFVMTTSFREICFALLLKSVFERGTKSIHHSVGARRHGYAAFLYGV